MKLATLLGLCGASIAACQPDLGDPDSLITRTRILAVRGDPAEAKPGVPVAYRALVVGPSGTVDDPALLWAFCKAPKPLTENNAVSAQCLGDAVEALGGPAPTITTQMPTDACALFGPDPPPGDLRPRDPDVTGGFYQPLRVRFGELTAFGLERVTCNLPNAPVDLAIELSKGYKANENPALTALSAHLDGAEVALTEIPMGKRVRLDVGWRPEDAETYPLFDPVAQAIIERREGLRVFWFVTRGELESDVTGRDGHEPEVVISNTWLAPEKQGEVHLWLVLRDERGGVDFKGYEMDVVP